MAQKRRTKVQPVKAADTRDLQPFPAPEPEDISLDKLFTKHPATLEILHRAGYKTVSDVRKASDKELLAIDGILGTRLKTIRKLTGDNTND